MSTWNDYVMPQPGKGSISSWIYFSQQCFEEASVGNAEGVFSLLARGHGDVCYKGINPFSKFDFSLQSLFQRELCFSSPGMLP